MKYKSKPIVIEAEQYKPDMEDGFEERFIDHDHPNRTFGIRASEEDTPIQIPYISTLNGKHLITNGDWIITEVSGDRYPCKQDVLERTYEPVHIEEFKVTYDESYEEFHIIANEESSKTIHPEEVNNKLWKWLRRKE